MKVLRWIFYATAAVSAVVLLARGWTGPFWKVHNPLTAEIALAVSIVCSWLAATRSEPGTPPRARAGRASPALMILAAVIGYFPILSMPLVTDDYIHLRQIADGEAPTPLGCLTHSCGGPQYFRPLGFSTYWAEWELWGTAAMPRHAFDLALHAACCVLFLLLIRRIGFTSPYDWLAGLVFAWNSIRPEAVAWPGARFDTLVLLFGLAAALAAVRGGRTGVFLSCLATAAACMSKESAFVIPVLLALLLGRKALTGPGRLLVASNLAVAVAIFAWRWVVLKGIGGYLEQDRITPTVLQFNPIVFLKTFFGRIWAVLWFPLNWSRPLEWWMCVGLTAGIVATCILLFARPNRSVIWLCVAGIVVACLPTHHMLLIGPSLERSRYLDLATPAFTIMLMSAAVALPRRIGVAALGLFACFHLAGLQHNLKIWSDVSRARYELCRNIARQVRSTASPVTLADVPPMVDGVYWRNGIEDCLYLDFNIPMGRVVVKELP